MLRGEMEIMYNGETFTLSEEEQNKILAQRKSYTRYFDKEQMLRKLEPLDLARIQSAIMDYQFDHILTDFEGNALLQIVFDQFVVAFQHDEQEYVKKTFVKRMNGSKGGRPRRTELSQDYHDRPKPNNDQTIDWSETLKRA